MNDKTGCQMCINRNKPVSYCQDCGPNYELYQSEKLEEEQKHHNKVQPFYLVWNEKQGVPHEKHADQPEAEKEARRIALKHPGESVHVLKVIATMTADNVRIERY